MGSEKMKSGALTVADLEIFRGGFSFDKTLAQLQLKEDQKKERSLPAL